MSTIQRVELDSTLRCADAVEFEKRMHDRVIGQDEAIEKLSWKIQTFMAGLNAPGRPAGILLFLGPTGDSAFKTLESPGPLLVPLLSPYLPVTAGKRIETELHAKQDSAVFNCLHLRKFSWR